MRLTAPRAFLGALLAALVAAMAYLKVHRRRGWTSIAVELSSTLEQSGVAARFDTAEHRRIARHFYRHFLTNWHQSLTLNVKCDGTFESIACTVMDDGELRRARPKSCSKAMRSQ